LHVQHLPLGNGGVTQLPAGTSVQPTGSLSGTGNVTYTGSCAANGPERTLWWATCPASAGGSFTASSCGNTSLDTVIAQFSARRSPSQVVNDDAVCALLLPNPQSRLTASIPAGAGLETAYLDVCGSAGPYSYSADITRP
jgi:hypothetical protein